MPTAWQSAEYLVVEEEEEEKERNTERGIAVYRRRKADIPGKITIVRF